MKDGSTILGSIQRIEDNKLFLSTTFAGEIVIALDQVQTLQSTDTVTMKLQNGQTVSQQLDASNTPALLPQIVLAGSAINAEATTQPSAPATPDVETVANLWKFEGAVGLSGKSGNSTKDDLSGTLKAVMEKDNHRLSLGLQYHLSESEISDGTRQKTTDETIANASYTSFFTPNIGWFADQTLERDRFENIDLRSLTSVGVTWKTWSDGPNSLELSTGVANRYEAYGFDLDGDGFDDRTGSQNLPGLDFGLKLAWHPANWAEWNTSLSINPVFEDFSDYRIDHLSTLDIPLGESNRWKLRVSLANQYRSIVTSGSEKLDTTYALSLLMKWD